MRLPLDFSLLSSILVFAGTRNCSRCHDRWRGLLMTRSDITLRTATCICDMRSNFSGRNCRCSHSKSTPFAKNAKDWPPPKGKAVFGQKSTFHSFTRQNTWLLSQYVHSKHPPDEEYCDDGPCDVNYPVASCFRFSKIEHAEMVAGPAQMVKCCDFTC